MKDSISIILTVHNQENIIQDVLDGILNNISELTKELIIVLDGCTDQSENRIDKLLPKAKDKNLDIKTILTPNINEVMANTVGLENSTCDYSIIVQDDCVITEKNFDKRLLYPFTLIDNLLAVSGRDAVDTRLIDGKLDYYNCGGKDAGTPRNIFSIRDGINRSPLMLNNEKVRKLNYFDKDFAPLDSDDVDLSIRGYKQFGYLVGSFVVNYESKLQWGTTRNNPESARIWEQSMHKNHKLIVDRHYDFIVGEKHSKDIVIEYE
jgi:glycosyltransferase involved in cell wall biosynthesis